MRRPVLMALIMVLALPALARGERQRFQAVRSAFKAVIQVPDKLRSGAVRRKIRSLGLPLQLERQALGALRRAKRQAKDTRGNSYSFATISPGSSTWTGYGTTVSRRTSDKDNSWHGTFVGVNKRIGYDGKNSVVVQQDRIVHGEPRLQKEREIVKVGRNAALVLDRSGGIFSGEQSVSVIWWNGKRASSYHKATFAKGDALQYYNTRDALKEALPSARGDHAEIARIVTGMNGKIVK